MFLKVTEVEGGQEILLNTDNISFICESSSSVLVNGIHSLGHGFIKLNEKDMNKLIDNIEIK